MDFLKIAKTVGAGIFSAVVPGGAGILSMVNEVLPEGSKLPANATGSQAVSAIDNLSPDLKAKVMLKKFDVNLEQIKQSHETLQTMLVSDATNPHSTRPKIALGSFRVVAISILLTVSTWTYAVFSGDKDMVSAVMNGWPFLLSVIAPLIILLQAYFGVLRKETQDKLNASNGGQSQGAVASIMGKLLGKK